MLPFLIALVRLRADFGDELLPVNHRDNKTIPMIIMEIKIQNSMSAILDSNGNPPL